MKLFTFDDNDMLLCERDPFDLFQCDWENGTEVLEWRGDKDRPILYVEINGRHHGFTMWAEDEKEAKKLLKKQPEYKKWMED